MLKKRILASSLASVMALSSVSVVAFADETATANFGEVVTRPELKEHLKTYDKLVAGDINNYGSVQALRFQEAYDHAAYVAADADATATDFTAAYQMVKAVADKLQQYTNEQLKELVDENTSIYTKNNIKNPDIMDNIYKEDAYLTFKNAYSEAEALVEVDDLMAVTDAYIKLDEAVKALKDNMKPVVKKTEYRAIIRKYEEMLRQFSKRETWRRGTVSINPTTGGATNELSGAVYITWGELQEIVQDTSVEAVVTAVNPIDRTGNKAVANTETGPGAGTWIGLGGYTDVEKHIYTKSKEFDDYKAASETTDDTIVAAYNAAVEAIDVFSSWKPIDDDVTAMTAANNTLNKYRKQLANDFEADLINALVVDNGSVAGLSFDSDGDSNPDKAALEYDAANGTLKGVEGAAKGGCVLRIDSGTQLIQLDEHENYKPDLVSGKKSFTIKITEGEDYMKYIPVRSSNVVTNAIVDDNGTDKVTAVSAALSMLEQYNAAAAKKSPVTTSEQWKTLYDATVGTLDENTTVTQPAGSSREYTFINRFLTYALQDLYPEQAEPCSHTRKDIEAKVEEAYDLINKTGDANIFAEENADLAAARHDAVEWLRESYKNKKYKDNVANTATEVIGEYDHAAFATEVNATTVYHTLSDSVAEIAGSTYNNGTFDALDAKLKMYPISYADIAKKIADVAEGIDEEAYGAGTAKVKEALDAVSYALSVLKVTLPGNEAFTVDRVFNGYNRLYVADNACTEEKNLKTALDNLDKVIKEATAGTGETGVKGDVNGDTVVNAKDALAILKEVAESKAFTADEIAIRDYNNDTVVNAKDALAILKAAANG